MKSPSSVKPPTQKRDGWTRLGQIFVPDGSIPWMASHAANPFAHLLDDKTARVYFNCRDADNRSSVASIDLDLTTLETSALSQNPLLGPGKRGRFDDSGVSVGCLIDNGDNALLYYLGWSLGVTVPFHNSIGLAEMKADGTFERVGRAPILGRSETDPYSVSYPWVLPGDPWRMWYGSFEDWGAPGSEIGLHVIRTAISTDGVSWQPHDGVCIGPSSSQDSQAFSRPTVLFEKGLFRMWFSHRGLRYSIGYAESADGLTWHRNDSLGLEPSGDDWESRAVSYAHVFSHQEKLWAFYCGNDYGRTGFGVATRKLADAKAG